MKKPEEVHLTAHDHNEQHEDEGKDDRNETDFLFQNQFSKGLFGPLEILEFFLQLQKRGIQVLLFEHFAVASEEVLFDVEIGVGHNEEVMGHVRNKDQYLKAHKVADDCEGIDKAHEVVVDGKEVAVIFPPLVPNEEVENEVLDEDSIDGQGHGFSERGLEDKKENGVVSDAPADLLLNADEEREEEKTEAKQMLVREIHLEGTTLFQALVFERVELGAV